MKDKIVPELVRIFSPNKRISRYTLLGLITVQVLIVFLFWFTSTSVLIPTPDEIFSALGRLIVKDNLIQELWTSISLGLTAMGITIIVSLILSYLTVLPFFRPIAFIITKGRFLTLVGLSFVFTMITHSGHQLKVSLLVFGMSVFFITSMLSVIQSVTRNELNHARTLRMSEWQVVWEVIILGRMDQVFEVIRQNFAISWAMLTLVEGIVRSEGGIGSMLLNQNKHLHLDAVFAIQFVILLVGILQDYLLGVLKELFCPYASLTLDKK
jgi:NitT/TauT family transport system permease protein